MDNVHEDVVRRDIIKDLKQGMKFDRAEKQSARKSTRTNTRTDKAATRTNTRKITATRKGGPA